MLYNKISSKMIKKYKIYGWKYRKGQKQQLKICYFKFEQALNVNLS